MKINIGMKNKPNTNAADLSDAVSLKPSRKFAKKEGSCDDSDAQRKIIIDELNELVGLNSIKQLVIEICACCEISKLRKTQNLTADNPVLHMTFSGNPGTGKTTVARYLGRLLKEMDILSNGHIIEIERADLVGQYIGQTAQKTREQLKNAQGGILFIDEAYSLARGGDKDFGREAIDTLVKGIEDNKNDLVVILAGYKKEMDYFIKSNPGLRSRIPLNIDFPDYTHEQLLEISKLMLVQKQYVLAPDAEPILAQIINDGKNLLYSGNARMVRNIIEKAIRLQAVRLVNQRSNNYHTKFNREQLMLITAEDLQF